MGNLKGVQIQRGKIGASIIDNDDAVCGLLATGVAVEADKDKGISGIGLGQTVKLQGLADAAAYGIDADYDSDNSLAVYRHVSEFFRMCGEGNTLYLMLYPQTVKPDALFDTTYAKRMVADAEGEIHNLAIAYTPSSADWGESSYESFDKYVETMVPAAQMFYDWTFETFRPCQVIVEGRHFDAVNAATALNLKAIKSGDATIDAYKVSVCIGQDWVYANRFTDARLHMADVGTMLGCLAARSVNENIGWVQVGNIANAAKGIWTVAALSNHKTIADEDAELESLDSKGYIFAIMYTGYAGFYWNNDWTCTTAVEDENGYFNEYTISYGRTVDKAVRRLRQKYLPYVKSNVPVDSATGLLPKSMVALYEAYGDEVFEKMQTEAEITQGKTTVDASSNLLIEPRELKVGFVVVPTGQVNAIKGTINLKTSV